MARLGRPDIYATHVEPHLDKIRSWYKTMTVRQIAAKLGVSKSTLYKYANQHPELAAALQDGKETLVDDLRSAIKKRALGYYWNEVQTTEEVDEDGNVLSKVIKTTKRHVPADLGSAHLLLKNLDPNWHDADAKTIALRERELQIKEKRAEAEVW